MYCDATKLGALAPTSIHYTCVGVIGAPRTGKSYITAKLLGSANKRCSVLIADPKQRTAYTPYSDDIVVAKDTEYNGSKVDSFIEARKDTPIWCLGLDDLDYFVKHAKESRWLENLAIASKGHWLQGCIWQSRRIKNLPYTLYQNSDYLIFTYGVDERDYDDLQEYAKLNIELYKRLPRPVYDPQDPNKIISAKYLILNRQTKEQRILGVK